MPRVGRKVEVFHWLRLKCLSIKKASNFVKTTKTRRYTSMQECLHLLLFPTSMSIIIDQHHIFYYNNSKTTKSYETFQPTRTFFMIHVTKPNWLRKMNFIFFIRRSFKLNCLCSIITLRIMTWRMISMIMTEPSTINIVEKCIVLTITAIG